MSDLGGSLISSAQQQSEKVHCSCRTADVRRRPCLCRFWLTHEQAVPAARGCRRFMLASVEICLSVGAHCVVNMYGVLQVLYALDAKVDSVVSLATGEVRGGGGVSPPEVWWESLSHRPPFKYVVSAYQQAHDAVVQTPIYTKCGPSSGSPEYELLYGRAELMLCVVTCVNGLRCTASVGDFAH